MTKRITEDKQTVLLLDDEPQYLDWLLDYLELKGYAVTTSTSVDAAVELLQESRYRVAIFDLSVPVSDEMLVVIRDVHDAYVRYPGAYAAHVARNKGHRSRQVIVYSVHESMEIREIAEQIGVQYITKGRPAQFKRELDAILAFDPTRDR